jgi:phage shock protein C
MYCNYCGKVIQDDANVCAYCGVRVGGVAARKRLLRPHAGRKIAGVALGMAEYFDIDISLSRLAWILAAILLFPFGILAYVIAWIVIPEAHEPAPATAPAEAEQKTA